MKNFILNNPKILKYFTFYTIGHSSFLGYYVDRVYETKQIQSVANPVFFFKYFARKEVSRLELIENKRIAEAMEAFEIDVN